MSVLAPVAPKLGKLIPLLSSNVPGEVVSAAAAIGRTLQAAGANWHDLAAILTTPAPAPQKPTAASAAPWWKPAPTWFGKCRHCLDHAEALTERELEFLRSVAPRLAGNRSPTPRQAAWINSIWSKVVAEFGE